MTPQQLNAMKLALEALEEAWYHVDTFQPTEKAIDLYDEARTAIKEALAQTQEPKIGCVNHDCDKCKAQRTWVGLTADEIWDEWIEQSKPERNTRNFIVAFARAIEAKLKEKNT